MEGKHGHGRWSRHDRLLGESTYRLGRTIYAELKEYDEGECWRIASDGHVFLDIEYDMMVRHATSYITSAGLAQADTQQIMSWVEGLPWQDDTVILHFGW